jgi:hypothetical protein
MSVVNESIISFMGGNENIFSFFYNGEFSETVTQNEY